MRELGVLLGERKVLARTDVCRVSRARWRYANTARMFAGADIVVYIYVQSFIRMGIRGTSTNFMALYRCCLLTRKVIFIQTLVI